MDNTTTTNNKPAINIGILAHVDAGKTTVTEQILYKSGALKTLGRVDTGNTATDSMQVEKERGITVRAATVAFEWQGQRVQLLDTPGHMDFIAEVERSLSVLDGAILVVSAREGVQAQTKVIFEALRRLNIPTILFVNKIDRMGVELEAINQQLHEQLSESCLPLQTVYGEGTREAQVCPRWGNDASNNQMIEQLCLSSEDLLVKYCAEETIDYETWTQAAKIAYRASRCFPVLYGTALHDIGVDPLMNLTAEWVGELTRTENEEAVQRLSGLVYKVDRDSRGNRRCFVRLYTGQLVLRQSYPVVGQEEAYKILRIATLKGAEPVNCEGAFAGDIAIVYDSERLHIGDWLGTVTQGKLSSHLAVPTLKAVVPSKDLAERKQILQAMNQLVDEDPFLDFNIHPITEAIEVKIFGTVQREILEHMLRERFDITTRIEEPATLYKERPKMEGHALMEMYKDGNFHHATVGLNVAPLPLGSGFQYETQVSFGDLQKTFQNGVQDGVEAAVRIGPQGWELTDLKVTFVQSAFNSVDSTPADFRRVAPEVLRRAIEQCGTELLEPMLAFEMHLPSYAIGRAVSDVLKMRGRLEDPVCSGDFALLKGVLPVETSKNYLSELADYTEGKGVLNMYFAGYEVLV